MLVAKVVKYVLTNRTRQYLEETANSFDIAKHKFGGPFKNEHVEWVTTFLRLNALFAIGSVVCGQIFILSYAQRELELRFLDWNHYSCYGRISIAYSDYLCGTIVILIHEIVISPLFGRCIPTVSATSLGLLGIFLSFLRIWAFIGIEVGAFLEQSDPNDTTMASKSCVHHDNVGIQFSSLWMIIIGSLEGLYILLLFLSGYKSMWTQSPSSMKGHTIGMMFALLGLNTMLQLVISSPFLFIHVPWKQLPLSCGIWYYMMQAVLLTVTFGLSLLVVVIKRYKQTQQNELGLNPVSLSSDSDD